MNKRRIASKLLGTLSIGMGLVITLFLSSEKKVHRNNAFTRRYPPHPIIKQYDLDIGFNSYYIAGFDKDLLYLGNTTAPWHLLKIHLETGDTSAIRLEPQYKSLRYRSLDVCVLPPYFFVMDGSIPFILRGTMDDWKAKPWIKEAAYFSKALPIDSHRIFIRVLSAKTQKYTLGLIEKTDSLKLHLDTTLLQAQLDGIFDVDGMLIKNRHPSQIGYLYYYRNQFMVMDSQLTTIKRQRTIDTVQTAHIEITGKEWTGGQIQMKSPPLVVNKTGYMHGTLFLIQSDRLGRNEPEDILDKASIIDVYNHTTDTYEFSFYISDSHGDKLREFALEKGILVALVGDRLAVYKTVDNYFKPKS